MNLFYSCVQYEALNLSGLVSISQNGLISLSCRNWVWQRGGVNEGVQMDEVDEKGIA